MLAHDASVDELAVAVHAANVERDRMRQPPLMLTDALRACCRGLRLPAGRQVGRAGRALRPPAARHRPGAVTLAPHYRGLTLRPGVGHWAMYEDAAAFNAGAVSWLDGPDPCSGR
jgi:2-hydroxy-6-oxonona-2,4-dienedioate hydrolase